MLLKSMKQMKSVSASCRNQIYSSKLNSYWVSLSIDFMANIKAYKIPKVNDSY